jgi:formylglycine-generating enzyme required for sulfatase activity
MRLRSIDRRAGTAAALLAASSFGAFADVFSMPTGFQSIEFVVVRNLGNPGELSGPSAGQLQPGEDRVCGRVDSVYSIAKHEVTVAHYCEFLNAVASTDPYALYIPAMGDMIRRSTHPTTGRYSYEVLGDWANRPVLMISWSNAVRFCNWLTNGQASDPASTEDGSYALAGATSNAVLMLVTRRPEAMYVLPTEDEWYKAAYHKNDGPTNHYWEYATQSEAMPSNTIVSPDPGNSATFWDNGYTGGVYKPTVVGAHSNSPSAYGTFDQSGNVYEFTETPNNTNAGRIARGGSFAGIVSSMRATYRVIYPYPTYRWGEGGMRVAVAGAATCAGDLNTDARVDDADFVIFAYQYNVLDCADPAMPAGCRADLNTDGVVDDADFVVFVRAYDDLLCS